MERYARKEAVQEATSHGCEATRCKVPTAAHQRARRREKRSVRRGHRTQSVQRTRDSPHPNGRPSIVPTSTSARQHNEGHRGCGVRPLTSAEAGCVRSGTEDTRAARAREGRTPFVLSGSPDPGQWPPRRKGGRPAGKPPDREEGGATELDGRAPQGKDANEGAPGRGPNRRPRKQQRGEEERGKTRRCGTTCVEPKQRDAAGTKVSPS